MQLQQHKCDVHVTLSDVHVTLPAAATPPLYKGAAVHAASVH